MFRVKNYIAAALAFFCLFGKNALTNEDKPFNNGERFVYDHVIVIGVDGAGNFHKDCDTPNMDRIFIENGAWTDYCVVSTPSISAQCWGSMLTGVKPYVHKLTNDNISKQYYTNSAYPTVFSLIRKGLPDAEIGSFCNWNPINVGLVEKSANVTLDTDYDPQLADKICTYITEKKPEFLFIQFDSVDHEGHSSGYGSEEYYDVIEDVDGYVGRIYDSVVDAGILRSTLLIITADHGGIGTSHGGASEEEMNAFFGVSGKSVNKTGDIEVYGRDLAAIVCYALGVEGNENWDSYIPQNMFLDNMTPEERPVDEIALHTNTPTPAAGTENALENYINMDTLRTGLFFDEGLNDIIGSEKVETVGTVYYPDGYYGSALRVSSEGYLSFPDFDFGDDDMTICFWLKVDEGTTGDPVIFSNKDWSNGDNNGFAYIYNNGAGKFNLGNGRTRADYDYSAPEDYTRWNHITIVFDTTLKHVVLYSNFEEISTDWLKNTFLNTIFETGLPFNFGQDGTGGYDSISAEFDDLLIFNCALEAEDIANLRNYYVK